MIDVSVCICTFRRPAGILRLLRSLGRHAGSPPSHEIIVIDNDATASAAPAIQQARAEGVAVAYDVEPLRGIARARNRSVQRARGEYVAFIDDDEEATPGWLMHLWGEVTRAGVEGGVGPVVPTFGHGVAPWMVEGRFFERARFPTGTVLGFKYMRTGNALIRRRSLLALPGPFDERYNFSGGEDSDLFRRLSDAGCRLIAVDSAVVHEHVTPARTTMRWLLRRRFVHAIGEARLDRLATPPRRQLRSVDVLAKAARWGGLGLLLFPVRRAEGFRYLMRSVATLGRLPVIVDRWAPRPYLEGSWR